MKRINISNNRTELALRSAAYQVLKVKINKFFVLDTLKHWTGGTGEMDKVELERIVKERVAKFVKFVFGEI